MRVFMAATPRAGRRLRQVKPACRCVRLDGLWEGCTDRGMIAPDALAKIALAPLLIPQGLRLRRSALILPEAQGPRQGRVGQGAPLRLLILGDSSAAGVGVAWQKDALSGRLTRALGKRFTVHWELWARTGATTPSTLRMLDRRPATQFDVAVTCLGVNDVTQGLSQRRWLAAQDAIFDRLENRHGVRATFVTGVPPMGRFALLPQPMRAILGAQARRYDRALGGMLAGVPGRIHYALEMGDDPALMAADGFHPGAAAYALWAEHLAELIGPLAPVAQAR